MFMGNLVLGGLLVVAAYTDLMRRQIPNRLIGAGLCTFLVMALWLRSQTEMALLIGCLQAGGLAFALHLIPYVCKAMGAGDVKLALVIGLLLGWRAWMDYLAAFGMVCLAVSLGLLLLVLCGRKRPKTLPMAPLMTAAYALCQLPIPWGQWV